MRRQFRSEWRASESFWPPDKAEISRGTSSPATPPAAGGGGKTFLLPTRGICVCVEGERERGENQCTACRAREDEEEGEEKEGMEEKLISLVIIRETLHPRQGERAESPRLPVSEDDDEEYSSSSSISSNHGPRTFLLSIYPSIHPLCSSLPKSPN